jgi:hypothetical protein
LSKFDDIAWNHGLREKKPFSEVFSRKIEKLSIPGHALAGEEGQSSLHGHGNLELTEIRPHGSEPSTCAKKPDQKNRISDALAVVESPLN